MFFGNLSKAMGALALSAACMGTAHASLAGDVLSVDGAYPTVDTSVGHEGTITAGSADYVDGFVYNVYASDSAITIHGTDYSVHWVESEFSGIIITDLTKNFGTNWTMTMSNIVGFDASDITLSGNKLAINWQGLDMYPETEIVITFGNVSPVPEPATYGMLLAGLTLIGVMAKRRKA